MNKTSYRILLCLAIGCLAAPVPLLASGSYTARPPAAPTTSTKAVERAQYALGQKIFTGKVKPDAKAESEAQTATLAEAQGPRLAALQAQLPKRAAKKQDLTGLAGKLTPEQLGALEYYINRRYGK